MSKPEEKKEPSKLVHCEVLEHATKYCSMVLAKGSQITIPKEHAKELEEQKLVKVVGVAFN